MSARVDNTTQAPDRGSQGTSPPSTRYPLLMKKLILLAVIAAIGVVLYKVLTTEIPIDDA